MAALKTKHAKNNILYDDVEKIKAAITNAGYDVRSKMGEVINDSITNVKDQSLLFKDNLSDYTAKRPIKSLGLALFTGLIIGFFLHK